MENKASVWGERGKSKWFYTCVKRWFCVPVMVLQRDWKCPNICFWEDENLSSWVFFLTGYGHLKVGTAGFCQLRSGCRGFVIYMRPGGSWQDFWTSKVMKVTTYTAEWCYGISMLYHCSSAPLTLSLREVLVSLSKLKQIWWACGLLWLTNWLRKP